MNRALLVLIAALALSGCETYAVARYSASVDNVQVLRSLRQKYPQGSLNVGTFKNPRGATMDITCRLAGPVRPPDGQAFEAYLQKALLDELRMAEVYSDKSPAVVSARVEAIDFSSMDGSWSLAALVTAGQQKPFSVQQRSGFTSSFLGESACNRTAQAFMPAVQDFVRQLITSPQLEQAFAESAAQAAPQADAVPGT